MTDPSSSVSSYVFYVSKSSLPERTEGAQLNRIFITDRKVTVLWNELVMESKSETLREETVKKIIYSLHENRQGVKYLTVQQRHHDGTTEDVTLSESARWFLLDEDSKDLVDKTLLSWLNYDTSMKFEKVKDELMFPVFRDIKMPKNLDIKLAIRMLFNQSAAKKALRENITWASFIKDICSSSAVKTDEDIKLIEQYPSELLQLAEMNLGDTLSSLYAKYGTSLLKFDTSCSTGELKLIRFMLKYLPAVSRSEATKLLLNMTKAYEEVISTSTKHVGGYPRLSSIPTKLRPHLAQTFLNGLRKTYAELRSTLNSDPYSARVGTRLHEVFNSWFYSNVTEYQIANDRTTINSLESRFLELFGTPLRGNPDQEQNSPLRFFFKGPFTFASVSELYVDDIVDNVFRKLTGMVAKNGPQTRGSGCEGASPIGFVDGYDNGTRIFGGVYLLGDIMDLIETAAKTIDGHLVKVGRKLTPENRLIFLSYQGGEAKSKKVWKYYDLGVTDPKRILALKKNNITKKTDVQTYNELPDEMFYELLAMEASEDLPPAAGRLGIRGLEPYLAMTQR